VNPIQSYTAETVDAYFRTVDAMAGFPNTLGFLLASSLINNTRSEQCAPVITAVVRDLKKYMCLRNRAVGQRVLPVGFGAGQYDGDLKVLNYLAAGDEISRIDFWTVCYLGIFRAACKSLIIIVPRVRIGGKSWQRLEPLRWPCMTTQYDRSRR